MNAAESVEAWIEKADGDYHAALVGMRQKKHPLYDATCFHCQQCAEKYLKGFLVRYKVAFRKTHDLRELNTQCSEIDGTFKLVANDLLLLKNYAVPFRYPGSNATEGEAREAVAAMKEIRRFVRKRLGLK
jgi:HEPN domain-containing protein